MLLSLIRNIRWKIEMLPTLTSVPLPFSLYLQNSCFPRSTFAFYLVSACDWEMIKVAGNAMLSRSSNFELHENAFNFFISLRSLPSVKFPSLSLFLSDIVSFHISTRPRNDRNKNRPALFLDQSTHRLGYRSKFRCYCLRSGSLINFQSFRDAPLIIN